MSEADTQTEHVQSGAPPDAVPVAIDIACPGCEYNLRGLLGPVVDCPECGFRSDVPELAARRWDKPWYKAPGFNTLAWPAVCVYLWYIILMPMSSAYFNSGVAVLGLTLVGLALWVLLMYWSYKVFNAVKGIWLALLMHVLVAGFLVSVLGLLATFVLGVVAIYGPQSNPDPVGIGLFVFMCCMGIFWVCRKIERAIARACIRHHVRRKPTE